MRTHLPRAAAVLALVALPLAACSSDDGGGSDTTDGPSDGALVVNAEDTLKFDPEALTAPAGEVTFALVDGGSLRHSFVLEDHEEDLHLEVAGNDESDEGTITLEAGDYTFYCDIAGHRAAGMEGTLTVE